MNKICPKCSISKPKTDEFFYRRSGSQAKWFRSWCKECELMANSEYLCANQDKRSAYKKQYRQENRENINFYKREYAKTAKGWWQRRRYRLEKKREVYEAQLKELQQEAKLLEQYIKQ